MPRPESRLELVYAAQSQVFAVYDEIQASADAVEYQDDQSEHRQGRYVPELLLFLHSGLNSLLHFLPQLDGIRI